MRKLNKKICNIKITRILFPKRRIESGDFAILGGKLTKIIEASEEIIVHPEYETITIKGIVPALKVGDELTFVLGDGETNKYGTTYNILETKVEFDKNDPEQLKGFLEICCGESIAKQLLQLEEPYELLSSRNDAELLKLKGIGKKKLEAIYDKFDMLGDKSVAYAKLQPLGLTKGLINKICSKAGGAAGAIDLCFNNPYRLVDLVPGIGFLKADSIAEKCNYNNPQERFRRALLHVLETKGESGKSYLYLGQIWDEAYKLVGMSKLDFDEAIKELSKSKLISVTDCAVALNKYLHLENDIARKVFEISQAESVIKVPQNWMEQVKAIEDKQGWKHTDEQLEGIRQVLYSNIVVIYGLAGTGKTTVTNAMSEILSNYHIDMCCLSAKAAQRLREVGNDNAKTIHKLLGINRDGEKGIGILYSDIVVLDEASMVSGTLFLQLLGSMKKGSKLIILGDIGQLTAIGNCSVLADLIASGVVPTVELTKIHRQAEKSAIITESKSIRQQKYNRKIGDGDDLVFGQLKDLSICAYTDKELIKKEIIESFLKHLKQGEDIIETQIIIPTKRSAIGTNAINLEIQKIINPNFDDHVEYVLGRDDIKLYKGDKILNMKNNYSSLDENGEKRPVWNGSLGTIEEIDIEEDSCVVDFVGIGRTVLSEVDLKNVTLGYAITVHSSQGSQWRNIVCAIEIGSYMLLNVEMLYTAITRASKNCRLIVEPNAFKLGLNSVEQNKKQTLLRQYLVENFNQTQNS